MEILKDSSHILENFHSLQGTAAGKDGIIEEDLTIGGKLKIDSTIGNVPYTNGEDSAGIQIFGPKDNRFSFLELFSAGNLDSKSNSNTARGLTKVMSVTSNGGIETKGGIRSEGRVEILDTLQMSGGVTLKHEIYIASDSIVVPNVASVSFLEIMDDKGIALNKLVLQGIPQDGQLLFIRNNDSEKIHSATIGEIPAKKLALSIYSKASGSWVGIGIPSDENSSQETPSSMGTFSLFSKLKETTTTASNKKEASPKDDESLDYNAAKKLLKVNGIDTKYFAGNVLDFRGADIINAALNNVTLGSLQHLSIDTLEIRTEGGQTKDRGTRMATVDYRGQLSTADNVRWNERIQALTLPGIESAQSDKLIIHSDLDLKQHTIRNFKLEEYSTLKNVIIEGGLLENTSIVNASFKDLSLGSIQVESLALFPQGKVLKKGAILAMAEEGKIDAIEAIMVEPDFILMKNDIKIEGAVDFMNSTLSNVNLISGSIKGESIRIDVENIAAGKIYLQQKRSSELSNKLAVIGDGGELLTSSITFKDGWVENVKVAGDINFRQIATDGTSDENRQGKIINAMVEGGVVNDLEELSVRGEAQFSSGINIKGNSMIDGTLSLTGSVFGSGPYIDVSDKRLKTEINVLDQRNILSKLNRLQAVSYRLRGRSHDATNGKRRDIGFIAQDVKLIFPEVVELRADGFFGVQYSRFVPLIIEGIKAMNSRMHRLEEENKEIKRAIDELTLRLDNYLQQ